MARPREDNVIYANFGAKKRVTDASEVHVPPRPTGMSWSPAATRVFNAAVQKTDQGRVKRGRQYAANGHVIDLQFRPGAIVGQVVGSQNEPFVVTMRLPYRSDEDLGGVIRILSETPNGITRARKGEMSEEILGILLAERSDDIWFSCDCPDNSPACKHAVAVAEKAAVKIDSDPTLLFQLRGLSLTSIERRVRATAASVAKENAEEGSEYFWSGRGLPDLPQPKVAPMLDDSDMDLLHKAMQTISFTNIDQLRAVADIEDMYDELTR
ncbi:SWIM zinc finger family protein [Corynebacterium lubricantis]|uniref:SWIM zinc finger family protein n=1 Tax=Corynebacterium lubricantis TaxID=541095 RepID=UPI00036ED837|nr:SWIM zinc finger family protein [Corynebacterium lubricantis]